MCETDRPTHWRLFVALPLPEPVRDEIGRLQTDWRRALPEGSVRWSKHDQLHLTLRFLGNVETECVAGLTEALRRACAAFSPLELSAEGIGFFPNPRRPRVLWVGVHDPADYLSQLQNAVESAVGDFSPTSAIRQRN